MPRGIKGSGKPVVLKTLDKTEHVEVASIKHASPEDSNLLKQRIADLEAKLAASEIGRSAAEANALKAAEAQGMLMQREIEEVPTGKFVTVKRLNPDKPYVRVGHKEDGRDILKPNFIDVKLPTYFYKIDMPPCGGTDYKTNGTAYYHGAVYEMDRDTLASVKERIFRMWQHDSSIHGSDENFYRPKQNPHIGLRMR